MSYRYYWISAIIVMGLTFIIGFVTKRQSKKDLFLIGIQVIGGLTILGGLVVGLAKLLVFLGIAEEAFIL